MSRNNLYLYSRERCHLCDEMLEDLEMFLRSRADQLAVSVRDVDSKAEWRDRYGLRVPVLTDDEEQVISEGRFDPVAMSRWIRAPAG